MSLDMRLIIVEIHCLVKFRRFLAEVEVGDRSVLLGCFPSYEQYFDKLRKSYLMIFLFAKNLLTFP